MARPRSNPEDLRLSPLMRQFFEIVEKAGLTWKDMSKLSGLSRETLIRWQRQNSPKVDNLEAALNAIGYRLEIKKKP